MSCMTLTDDAIRKLAAACAQLATPQGNYLEDDPLRVCVLAVIDFQQTETAVLRATKRFEDIAVPGHGLRTLEDLDRFLAEHPDDGQAAQSLWAYNLHTRAAILRGIVSYFLAYKSKQNLLSDIDALRHWARNADFKTDFEGRVKGLGIKAFAMMQQRLGVPTAAPDSRIKTFIARHLGAEPQDECAISLLNAVADRIGRSRTELDWAVWEFDKRRPVKA